MSETDGKKKAVPAKKSDTSWGKVADWYHDTVEERGSYQRDLILPNLLRNMQIKKGETILDLACGEGFFSRQFAGAGATVIASDISLELIAIAKKASKGLPLASAGWAQAGNEIQFYVASADNLKFLSNASVDKVVIVLALQNIENVAGVISECQRVLRKNGKLFIVLNHPAFRIPKESSWGFTADNKVQYRRVDRYSSPLKTKIQMHPGDKPGEMTVSFHRPLQFYFKIFKKAGLAVTGLEEWNSEKKSGPGPRAEAENLARREIPLFLLLEITKI